MADGEKHDVPEMKWTLSERGANGRGWRWGKYFLPDGIMFVILQKILIRHDEKITGILN